MEAAAHNSTEAANFSALGASTRRLVVIDGTIHSIMPLDGTGPGLASVRPSRVVSPRALRLLSVPEGWWARMIERADVVSEGAEVVEPSGPMYYGTTSVRCVPDPRPEPVEKLTMQALARLMLADPHARLRLVRLAHREAASRATAALGVMRVELHARGIEGRRRGDPESPCIDVQIDVSGAVDRPAARPAANQTARRARASRAPRRP